MVSMWRASDQTIVVPHRPHSMHSKSFAPPAPLASAAVEPAVAGVSCEVSEGLGLLEVTVDGEAQPGTATCRMTLASGERADQNIAVVAY
jgi:hypothetical protein